MLEECTRRRRAESGSRSPWRRWRWPVWMLVVLVGERERRPAVPSKTPRPSMSWDGNWGRRAGDAEQVPPAEIVEFFILFSLFVSRGSLPSS